MSEIGFFLLGMPLGLAIGWAIRAAYRAWRGRRPDSYAIHLRDIDRPKFNNGDSQ